MIFIEIVNFFQKNLIFSGVLKLSACTVCIPFFCVCDLVLENKSISISSIFVKSIFRQNIWTDENGIKHLNVKAIAFEIAQSFLTKLIPRNYVNPGIQNF